MKLRNRSAVLFTWLMLAVLLLPAGAAEARVRATLSGSPASMTRQNKVATTLGYTFVEDSTEVRTLLEEGALVPIEGNADYDVLKSVSYPFARPVVRLFIERLAAQYREATGEQLVVTSLTRPSAEQPRNAHQLSVHPAGIAIDFRISDRKKSRQWLESVLRSLERQGRLDVTEDVGEGVVDGPGAGMAHGLGTFNSYFPAMQSPGWQRPVSRSSGGSG